MEQWLYIGHTQADIQKKLLIFGEPLWIWSRQHNRWSKSKNITKNVDHRHRWCLWLQKITFVTQNLQHCYNHANRFFNIPKTSFWIPFFAKKATPTIDHPYKIKSSSDLLFNSANIIPFQNGFPLLYSTTTVWMDCSFWARAASFFAAFLLLSFTERGETQIIRTICYCAEAVEKVIGTQRGPFLEPFRSLTLIRALP